MEYVIMKACACNGKGKMFDIRTGKQEKCLHCNGKGIRIIKTTMLCKYCGEPIESGFFCNSCGKSFRENMEKDYEHTAAL